MSILDFVPSHYTARPEQKDILLQVEKYWNGSDVIVIPGKVGIGKSLISMTISAWRASKNEKSAVITPRVALQDQYAEAFPGVPVLKGKHRYSCSDGYDSCGDKHEVEGKYCKECPFKRIKKRVKESSVAVFNLNSYFYSRDPKEIAIFDEAHLIHDFLGDQFTLKLWKHKDKYPDDVKTAGDLAIWLEGRSKKLETLIGRAFANKDKELAAQYSKLKTRYDRVRGGLSKAPANFFIEKLQETYRGKTKDLMKVRPASLLGLPEILWPERHTKKLVLMSGTLNSVDLRRLGLGRSRRIKWINCKNPIAPAQRPVDASWGINMSYKYQNENVGKLCKKITELADKHENSGIVHTTYSLAEKMKPHLKDDRYMWHDSENREEMLLKFQKTPGAILIASGMSEGIDLAGRQFDWQVVTKIMYPNKGDMLIDKWYREDMDWILWLTVRTLLQQTGRIVRSPDDYGITYILDGAFGNPAKKRWGLWTKASKYVPEDYKESIKWR